MKHLTAKETAAFLGISVSTVYAYVSRGLLKTVESESRRSLYHRQDVETLKERQRLRSQKDRTIDSSLDWGSPIVRSSLSHIVDGELFYRGVSIHEIVKTHTFEDVAGLLWEEESVAFTDLKITSSSGRPFLHNASIALAELDFQRTDELSNYLVDAQILTGSLAGLVSTKRRKLSGSLSEFLAIIWRKKEIANFLDLILCVVADHGTNVSTFTTRCVSSAGASTFAAALAGVSAMKGAKHGGAIARIEALFAEAKTPAKLMSAIRDRQKRGESLPGFSHPLYPEGDCRTKIIADAFFRMRKKKGTWMQAISGLEKYGLFPTIDTTLAAIVRDLGLPKEAGISLFVIGRSVGWSAHIKEQAVQGNLIRPRVRIDTY